MKDINKKIPNNIWLLWYQGISNAPHIVKKCVSSWQSKNPTWNVVVLDSHNLHDYVELDISRETLDNLSLAHQSDLVRLSLLSKCGGVWADATTFCVKPLDEWIHDYGASGFFAFSNPGRDRIMSNWFMASQRNSPICTRMYDQLSAYWVQNKFESSSRYKKYVTSVLARFLNKNSRTTRYWFNPLVTKVLKVYPYFVFHYMFELLVSRDNDSRFIWQNTKKMDAVGPHLIQNYGMHSTPSQAIIEQIDNSEIPLFKLTYKHDHREYSKDSLIYHLLEDAS